MNLAVVVKHCNFLIFIPSDEKRQDFGQIVRREAGIVYWCLVI